MKLSCAVPVDKVSEGFVAKLAELGITPIITPKVIRVVYEESSNRLGEKIIALFEAEPEHDIVAIKPKTKGAKHKKGGGS